LPGSVRLVDAAMWRVDCVSACHVG